MSNLIFNLSKSIRNPITTQIYKLINSLTFPGGEEHVRIHDTDMMKYLLKESTKVTLIGDMSSSSGIMKTIMFTNLLRSFDQNMKINFLAPYFPYARQDRRMTEGEPLSIKVFANLINQQKYHTVSIFDPHSDVTPALIDNVNVVDNIKFVEAVFDSLQLEHYNLDLSNTFIVSPDAGAEKKISKIAKHLAHHNVVYCTKQRDVLTGQIIATNIPLDVNLENKTCVIIDDIIDGGYTFIELAKGLKNRGVSKIYLVASHGIFSRGIDIFNDLIDDVFTTDSVSNIASTINLIDRLNFGNCGGCTNYTEKCRVVINIYYLLYKNYIMSRVRFIFK